MVLLNTDHKQISRQKSGVRTISIASRHDSILILIIWWAFSVFLQCCIICLLLQWDWQVWSTTANLIEQLPPSPWSPRGLLSFCSTAAVSFWLLLPTWQAQNVEVLNYAFNNTVVVFEKQWTSFNEFASCACECVESKSLFELSGRWIYGFLWLLFSVSIRSRTLSGWLLNEWLEHLFIFFYWVGSGIRPIGCLFRCS